MDGTSRVLLGFGTTKESHVIASVNVHSLEAEANEPGATLANEAQEATVRDEKLIAWTTKGPASAWRMRSDAAAVDPNDLGFHGAIIGKPAMAVALDGKGVLAFVESNGDGFQLVATRVLCARP